MQHASTHISSRPDTVRALPLMPIPHKERPCICPESPVNVMDTPVSQGGASGCVNVPSRVESTPSSTPSEALEATVTEQSEDIFDESMYVGLRHKPADFRDGNDGDKDYYEFENRMSYEYRPSMDCDRPSWTPMGTIDSVRPSTMTHSSVNSSRASSFGGSFMSSIRRSIDAVRDGIPDGLVFHNHRFCKEGKQRKNSYDVPRKMD